ncbi:hypothetical protein ACLK10_16840 [Escherichia coli]
MIANTAIIFIDELGEKTLVYSPGSDHEWDKEKALQAIAQSRYYYDASNISRNFVCWPNIPVAR